MATENFNTYSLCPKIAASLRVPPIEYENGIVPGDVLARVTGQPELDTPLSKLDDLLEKRLLGGVK